MGNDQGNTGENGAGFNPQQTPRAQQSTPQSYPSKDIDDARIVDEVVIKPPTPAPAPAPVSPAVAPSHAPPPIASSSLKQNETSHPPVFPPPASPPTTPPPIPPVSTPNIALDSLDIRAVTRTAVPSSTPPPAPQPTSSVARPATEEKTVPVSPAAKEFAPHAQDVSKLVQDVKLPERPFAPQEKGAQKKQTVYDTSLVSTLAATEQKESSASPPTPLSQEEAEKRKLEAEHPSAVVAPVHTLKNDFQSIVREKKISLVRAAALEQDKRRDLDKKYDLAASARKRRSFGIIFASVLFALLGTAAFFGVALVTQERSAIPNTAVDSSLLFAEATVPLPMENLTAYDLKRLIAQARLSSNSALGSITRIVPVIQKTLPDGTAAQEPATLEMFLRAIDARAPAELLRALGSDFFFGIHTVDENAPIFIIPVTSYERAFAGMLEWEKALNADLAPMFTAVPAVQMGESGLLEERQFKDVVMRNYDVRVLTDDAGTIQLYYSFPTRELLIIAESPYSFAEILARLRASRRL